MSDKTEEEIEEEIRAEEARKRFCKMLYLEVRSTEDPENFVENIEVVELLKDIAAKLRHAKEVDEGIDLLPIEENVIEEDRIIDGRQPFEFTQARYEEMREIIIKCLNKLTERERNVLSLRFGLKDNYAKTLEEVGREFRKTRERIREIEAKALKKMKKPTRIKQLHKFFEAADKPKPEALKQLGL